MAQQLPPELQQELMKFDNIRRQHDALQGVLQQMKSELTELKGTLEELSKLPDDTVTYRIVGQVMFKVEKPKLVDDLEDKRRTTELSLESYTKRAESMAESIREMSAKLQTEFAKYGIQ
ncbi:MAG: prefoldin subunit beta [Candidatus Thorarchaeota archaeon]|nr:prefoldin subunit beta [Candidatus Thorarchaeota archaeon]